MPRILVTNDDGYRSEGIHALADALRAIGDVTEVAPLGIPSIAVSLRATRGEYDFSHAARAAASFADAVLRRPLPPRTFLNINVPKGLPKGHRVTVQAKRNHVTSVAERHDPKGRPYYWIEEGENAWHADERSDYHVVRSGYVSITPLQPDLTAYQALQAVEDLSVDKAAEVR
jgi:5'-nucleotidase